MAINLATMQRADRAIRTNPSNIHPALIKAVQKIKAELDIAKAQNRKSALYIPLGWDSHIDELAVCSSFKQPGQDEQEYLQQRKKCRFNNNDFMYFYNQIYQLLNHPVYKDSIQSVYFSLEGGYTKEVNELQLELFLTRFACLTPKAGMASRAAATRVATYSATLGNSPPQPPSSCRPKKRPRPQYTREAHRDSQEGESVISEDDAQLLIDACKDADFRRPGGKK